ncbi:MAG TPA: AAA family ATPase [Gemmatimonadota bacterium]|nr:AAA family ATPase [Gemmatimonadota bacterium]
MSGSDLRLVRLQADGYGRLREFVFEPARRPGSVVRAPNEAGKSTLASAIFHALFGFEDKALEDAFRPWEGGPYRVTLEWALGPSVACRIARDFDTQEVTVEWWRGGALERRWEGAPNPRGRSADRDGYSAELERLLGFTSPEIFRQTTYIGPGDAGRPLAAELLRLLSGSERADFRTALAELEAGYHGLTQADLDDPSRAVKRTPRDLERIAARRAELAREVASSRAAHATRREAAEALAAVRERLEAVERELAIRSQAGEAIRRRNELRRERVGGEARLARIDAELAKFTGWETIFRERELELRPLARYLQQPADFPERMDDLDRLDREAARASAERAAAGSAAAKATGRLAAILPIVAGALLVALGLTAVLVDGGGAGEVASLRPAAGFVAAAGLLLAVWGVWRRIRRRRERRALLDRCEELMGRIASYDEERRALAGPLGLDPEAIDPAGERRQYERARELGARIDGMRETRDRLGDRPALERERRALEGEVLAVLRLEERRLLDAHPWLESDPDVERRFFEELDPLEAERARLVEEELDRRRALASQPAGTGDPRRLEAEIADLDEESARLCLERDAYRLAHTILSACKRDFVEVAVRRLESRIGPVFQTLTDGRYREVEIDPATLELSVHSVEKIGVPAGSLSRGARDQLYFALRVAVLEVLAAERSLPIILDDPFLHFDDERLARAGQALARLGDTHQILLFSHDARVGSWGFPQAMLPDPAGAPAEIGSPSGD